MGEACVRKFGRCERFLTRCNEPEASQGVGKGRRRGRVDGVGGEFVADGVVAAETLKIFATRCFVAAETSTQ